MQKAFVDYLNQELEVKKKHHFLLAVSGGVDSMVMEYLFRNNHFNYAIAHCNFCLRGEESDMDEQFIAEHASTHDIKLFVKKFDTTEFANDSKQSIQMAARELRYNWFDQLANEEKFDFIAIASHKNDVLETMLINLTRGTGVAGLHGILPKKGSIIRPLLFASKQEILEFANNNKIEYREDSSNSSDKYSRNKIRQVVIPALKEINPTVEENAIQTANQILQFETAFKKVIEEKRKQIIEETNSQWQIKISALKELVPAQVWLYELLLPFEFNGTAIENLIEAIAANQPGKKIFSKKYQIVIDRKLVFILPRQRQPKNEGRALIESSTKELHEPIGLKISKQTVSSNLTFNKNTAWLDLSKLSFPLTVRKWQSGDFFQPLGMAGKKKLSDYLIDNKIPVTEKEHTFVIETEGDICWVVGHQIDDRYKVTNKTEQALKIELIE